MPRKIVSRHVSTLKPFAVPVASAVSPANATATIFCSIGGKKKKLS
jgi:hypothetical protein